MSDAARFKISKRLIQLTLISGALMASTAWGFEPITIAGGWILPDE